MLDPTFSRILLTHLNPANDNAPAANDNQETTATSTPDAIEAAPAEPAVVEDQAAEPAPLPEVQAANDNAAPPSAEAI